MCNKKEVLILTSTFPRWQGDTDPPFVFDLCRRIMSRYSIKVLCPHVCGTKKKELYHGIQVERFKYFINKYQTLAYEGGILNRLKQKPLRYFLIPFFILFELVATVRMLCRESVDLINAHWLLPQGMVAVLTKNLLRSSVPVVCTLHGGDVYALNGALVNAVKRMVLKRATVVIVVSRAMQEKVLSLSRGITNIHVIPMGVDLENMFIPSAMRRRKKSLLFVGRFVEKKGLCYLIKAMSLVLQKHPDAHLTVAGHGPEEKDLKQLVSERGLKGKITFKGAIENTKLPELFQLSEVLVFPSIQDARGDMEGFGLVLVEAMGCGCAVVASDLPAVHDIIINNETGILVEQKNPEHIADRIIYLFDNKDVRDNLGSNGRKYVFERYDWKIIEKKYCDIFDKITI